MKKSLMPYVAKCVSSDQLLSAKRKAFALKRVLFRQTPTLDIFLKPDDPYSYLLVQALKQFIPRFSINVRYHVFQNVNPKMFPKMEMWRQYSRYDAAQLATLYGFHFPKNSQQPNKGEHVVKQLACELVNIETDADFLTKADHLMHTFWFQSQPPTPNMAASQKATLHLTQNETLLAKKGHYLGAMINFEGEWYWGVDRLDHLENRLIDTGLARQPREQIHFNKTYAQFCQRPPNQTPAKQGISRQPLVLYWSARSPYSYIGLEQATKLAKYYHIPLVIKPVLPMMMRGMHVPETKKMYIFLDTKREARKLGIPYGFVADPLGAAVERCYALVEYAQSENKLHQFLLSFARGVNAEGIRAETDSGLKKIVTRCGLDWSVAKSKLSDRHWQNWAQDNLDEMLLMGCWGVPSIRYGNTHFWGQDRFGMIENAIRKELETKCILRTG